MNKIKEKNVVLIIILFVVALYVGNLLPVNYPSDIIYIKTLGLKDYAHKWFLPSGRLIGIVALNILHVLNFSVDQYIFLMKILAIIIATASIYLFYDLLNQKVVANSKKQKALLLIATLFLFLNHGTYEFFYYPEAGVMWLAILFVVLALRCMVQDEKGKYLKTFLYLFITVNCYQAIVYFYLPVLILFMGLYKKTIKDEWIELLKNTAIVLGNLLIGFIIISIARTSNDVEIYQEAKIIFDFELFKTIFFELLIAFSDTSPNNLILVGNLLIYIVAVIFKKKIFNNENDIEKIMLRALIIFWMGFFEIYFTISLLDFYNGDRIQFAFLATFPINVITMIIYSNILNVKQAVNISLGVLSVIMCVSLYNSWNLTYNSRLARAKDEELGKIILDLVTDYEKTNNKKITKIEYCYDDDYYPVEEGIRHTWEITTRIISNWSTEKALQYYLKKNIAITYNQDIYSERFEKKNWDVFDKEQLIFDGNTMYICFY